MGPDVHLERPKADILLVTVLAGEGLPCLGIAVQLLVLGQSGEGGVALAAQAALELLCLYGVGVT